MIVDAILAVLFGLVDSLVSALPTFSAPFTYAGSSVESAVDQAASKIAYISGWVDMPLWATLIEAVVAAYVIAGTVMVTMWVYNKVAAML